MQKYSIIFGGVLLSLLVGCGAPHVDVPFDGKNNATEGNQEPKEGKPSDGEGKEEGTAPQKEKNDDDEAGKKPAEKVKTCDSSNRFCTDPLKFCPEDSQITDLGKQEGGEVSPIYGKCVKSVHFGSGAGYGQVFTEGEPTLYKRGFPDIVLGPPDPNATTSVPALDVLSLGKGGSIVIDFGYVVYDYSGPDLFIFENAFEVGGGGSYMELGKVSVSLDGINWTPFPCDYQKTGTPPLQTCAGVKPTKQSPLDPKAIPLSSDLRGGDALDLADIGVEKFRYVKIEDRSPRLSEPLADDQSYGFDLDAVGANIRRP